MKSYFLMLIAIVSPVALADDVGNTVFELGTIEVTAKGEQERQGFVMQLNKNEWQAYQAKDVAEALRHEPGVTLSAGGVVPNRSFIFAASIHVRLRSPSTVSRYMYLMTAMLI